MAVVFKLKCVGCGTQETRAVADCKEQPFCNKCGSPMTLSLVKGT